MQVVICGAGVIGASIAYFLSRRGVTATVVERSGVACAASGKAGGFLALDWCDGTPVSALARRSFSMHAELPSALGTDYDYRRLDTFAVAPASAYAQAGDSLDWLDERFSVRSVLGTQTTTAQVHPEKFTHALMRAAIRGGATLRKGCVEGVRTVPDGSEVRGVVVDGERISADVVVIAMGPWSSHVSHGLPLPPVGGLKGHSITVRPERVVPADALFAEYQDERGVHDSPEVYPRPDGEVYVCGLSDDTPVPESPERVRPREGACDALKRFAKALSPCLVNAQLVRRQACFRPITPDGLPLLGRVPGVAGAYVATGHSCWGILNAPASGAAMAELIVDGTSKTVDLSPFNPERFVNPEYLRAVGLQYA